MRLGVLASHEGTTLQAVIDAFADAQLAGEVALVISNNSNAGALQKARAAGIATRHLSSRTHPEADMLDTAICRALEESAVDTVLLAGYMKRLGPRTLGRFAGRHVRQRERAAVSGPAGGRPGG